MKNNFDITGKVVLITGGSGLMGRAHAEAVAEFGAIPVIGDIDLSPAGCLLYTSDAADE